MYVIFERKTTDKFEAIGSDLKDFKEVLEFLNKRHKGNVDDEETRIIYYEREEELTDLYGEYGIFEAKNEADFY